MGRAQGYVPRLLTNQYECCWLRSDSRGGRRCHSVPLRMAGGAFKGSLQRDKQKYPSGTGSELVFHSNKLFLFIFHCQNIYKSKTKTSLQKNKIYSKRVGVKSEFLCSVRRVNMLIVKVINSNRCLGKGYKEVGKVEELGE